MHDTGRLPLYWEMTDEERRAIPPERVAEDEAAYVWHINHGRLLARIPGSQQYHPVDVEPPVRPDEEECTYRDPVAALLAAAEYGGFDPREICEEAMSTLRLMRTDGLKQAVQLRGPDAPADLVGHIQTLGPFRDADAEGA